jgi:putative nucleotidyltransferase with HDIG domain
VSLRFVEAPGTEALPLSPLLERLRPILAQQEFPVYLVGGAVRDALLGRTSHDLDFVVPQQAVRLAFEVADALGAPAYVLDSERDTGRVVLPDEGTVLDFARFRGPDLIADLRDRDFTMNALALPVTAESPASVIDPCNGQSDLTAQLVRLTHSQAMADDPVRALRALRLALSFGFTMTEETATAVSAAADQLHTVATERIRDELLKLLQTAVPHEAIRQMAGLNLLASILPEVAGLEGVAQSAPHHEPVLAHTMSVLRWLAQLEATLEAKEAPAEPALATVQAALADYTSQLMAHLERNIDGGLDGRSLLRLAALFHDVGKKETQTIEEGGHGQNRIRFIGHDKVGAVLAAKRLRRLSLSNQAVDHVKRIVAGHMRPLLLANAQGKTPSRRAVYRFYRDTKTAGLDIGLLSLADHLATYDGVGDPAIWLTLVALVGELYRHYFEQYEATIAPRALLNGQELMAALQLKSGPEVGRLLRLIKEAQAAGDITTAEEAIHLARSSSQ